MVLHFYANMAFERQAVKMVAMVLPDASMVNIKTCAIKAAVDHPYVFMANEKFGENLAVVAPLSASRANKNILAIKNHALSLIHN